MRRSAGVAGGALLFAAILLACLPALAQPDPEVVPPPSRNVTPPGITPGPDGSGPLIREPKPRPPSPAPEGAQWRRFFLAVATDAGRLAAEKRQIRIAGVVAPAAPDTCRVGDGAPWACGTAALTAFRLFLRGRSVECLVAKTEQSAALTAPCRLGKTDLGLWLLTHGWGMAAENASDEYRKAQETARCARLGMWRDEPPCG